MTKSEFDADDDGARGLFLEYLPIIERAIRFAGRSLRQDEAEDFASWAMLKLIENDYGVIAQHDRRSSFAGFIAVVTQRLLLDYRVAQWGKWHASARAKRMGEPAITIEAMLHRDGRSIDDVLSVLKRRWPELTRESIMALADQLPPRAPRPRTVDLALAQDTAGAQAVEEMAFASDRAMLARRIADLVRSAMKELGSQERLILRLRYEGDMSVADISRALHLEQKPLYRRIQRALDVLRAPLEAAGIGREVIEEVLACPATDFDLDFGEEPSGGPSNDEEDS